MRDWRADTLSANSLGWLIIFKPDSKQFHQLYSACRAIIEAQKQRELAVATVWRET